MKQLFSTAGRSSRSMYWNVIVGMFLFIALLGLIQENVPPSQAAESLIGLSVLPVLFVGLVAQIRRWHDLGKSGWWVLINLIPIIGGIWTLIECGFVRGTNGNNQYGTDPLAPAPPPLPQR